MAPLTDISRAFGQQSASAEPISRTMQYRKVTKPLLERQRRARINRCLDELKEILVSGLQNEGENVARLEKADILELSVRELRKRTQQYNKLVKSQQNPGDDEIFRNGYATAAQEISKILASRGVDINFGSDIMIQLGNSLNKISSPQSSPLRPGSSCSNASSSGEYRPYTPPASPTESQFSQLSPSLPLNMSSPNSTSKFVWRPW